MAHIDRAQQAEALAFAVGASYVNMDDGTLGCEASHLKTWRHLATTSTRPWAVVLEDDALPVDHFTDQLEAVLLNAPTPVVSLYLGRTRPPAWQLWAADRTAAAQDADACYIIAPRLLHGVAVAIRTELVPSMLATAEGLTAAGVPIDEAIHVWLADRHRLAYCWPSIVDHDDGPTLVAHRDGKLRTQGRVAWRAGTRSHWSTTVLERPW